MNCIHSFRHVSCFFAAFIVIASAEAQSEFSQEIEKVGFTYGLETDFSSRYVWRGIELSDGPIAGPYIWCDYAGFTISGWGAISLSSVGDDRAAKLTEFDVVLEYEYQFKSIVVKPAFNYVTIPGADASGELLLQLSYLIDLFTLSISNYVDILTKSNPYFGEASVTYSRELTDAVTIETDITGGWSSSAFNSLNYGESDKSMFSLASLNLSSTWYAIEYFYVQPHLSVSYLVNSSLRDEYGKNFVYHFGAAFGVDF